jgi:hypothetical protein
MFINLVNVRVKVEDNINEEVGAKISLMLSSDKNV